MISALRLWAWAHDTIHVPRALHVKPLVASPALGVVKRLVGAILLTLTLTLLPPLSIAALILVGLVLAMEVVKLL